MSTPVIRTFTFTVTFPSFRPSHVQGLKLHRLACNQLSDREVIETIDHLFGCSRCFENYRSIRDYYRCPSRGRVASG